MSTARTASDRSFGLTFAAVLGAVAAWQLWHGAPLALAWLVVAASFLAAALIRARWLAPLNRAWTLLGAVLHRVVNPLVLGAIYYAVLTPTALVMRLRGHDPLTRHFDPQARSYWRARKPPGPPPQSLRHEF